MIVNPFINLTADLKLLELWESRWCLNFNVDKCMVMQIGSCNPKNQYLFGGVPLRCVESEKDLRIIIRIRIRIRIYNNASLGISIQNCH